MCYFKLGSLAKHAKTQPKEIEFLEDNLNITYAYLCVWKYRKKERKKERKSYSRKKNQSNHVNIDTKELFGQKSNSLIFLKTVLWSALRKISEFQWRNQDVQTGVSRAIHWIKQLTESYAEFWRAPKNEEHYRCNASFNIVKNLAIDHVSTLGRNISHWSYHLQFFNQSLKCFHFSNYYLPT